MFNTQFKPTKNPQSNPEMNGKENGYNVVWNQNSIKSTRTEYNSIEKNRSYNTGDTSDTCYSTPVSPTPQSDQKPCRASP